MSKDEVTGQINWTMEVLQGRVVSQFKLAVTFNDDG